jgi:hypothetical protein
MSRLLEVQKDTTDMGIPFVVGEGQHVPVRSCGMSNVDELVVARGLDTGIRVAASWSPPVQFRVRAHPPSTFRRKPVQAYGARKGSTAIAMAVAVAVTL